MLELIGGKNVGTVKFYRGEDLHWADLWGRAERISGGVALNTSEGDRVAVLLEESAWCGATFAGVFLAGCDLISLPMKPGGMSVPEYHNVIKNILKLGEVKLLLGGNKLRFVSPVGEELGIKTMNFEELEKTLTLRDGIDNSLIQFTSGTTGTPKGVVMPMLNLSTNVKTIADRGMRGDSWVSWMPWTHDMGLVGGFLTNWVLSGYEGGRNSLYIPTDEFIKDPGVWITSCAEIKTPVATLSAGFALKFAKFGLTEDHPVDMSAITSILVGGERLATKWLRDFDADGVACGLASTSLSPAYGLAENGVAVSMVPVEDKWKSAWWKVDWGTNSLIAAGEKEEGAVELVSCGVPLDNVKVSIQTTDTDTDEEENKIGELATARKLGSYKLGSLIIESPSLFSGYLGEKGSSKISNNKFKTGDVGAIINNEIWVLGRGDAILVVHGENMLAIEAEDLLAGLWGGITVVCEDPSGGYCVILEEREGQVEVNKIINIAIKKLTERFGIRPSRVGLLSGSNLPKTASGKIKRSLVVNAVSKNGYWV